MLNRIFLDHPRAIDESYGEHFVRASSFGFSMILGGLACFVHALVPGFFITTGSDAIDRLYGSMVINRRNRLQQGTHALSPNAGE